MAAHERASSVRAVWAPTTRRDIRQQQDTQLASGHSTAHARPLPSHASPETASATHSRGTSRVLRMPAWMAAAGGRARRRAYHLRGGPRHDSRHTARLMARTPRSTPRSTVRAADVPVSWRCRASPGTHAPASPPLSSPTRECSSPPADASAPSDRHNAPPAPSRSWRLHTRAPPALSLSLSLALTLARPPIGGRHATVHKNSAPSQPRPPAPRCVP